MISQNTVSIATNNSRERLYTIRILITRPEGDHVIDIDTYIYINGRYEADIYTHIHIPPQIDIDTLIYRYILYSVDIYTHIYLSPNIDIDTTVLEISRDRIHGSGRIGSPFYLPAPRIGILALPATYTGRVRGPGRISGFSENPTASLVADNGRS